MAVKNVKNRKHSVILAVLFCALVCYFVATLISLQVKVRAEEREVADLKNAYQQKIDDNAELEMIIDSGNEAAYIEKIAREQYGYVMPDERVYYDSTAS